MNGTGIVRRIDELGRIVIPKEIRNTMRIGEGSPLEIFTGSEGEMILKKYSEVKELRRFSDRYAEILFSASGYPTLICDLGFIISAAGVPKDKLLNSRISPAMGELMERRESFHFEQEHAVSPVEGSENKVVCGAPIIAGGNVCGAVVFLSADKNTTAGDAEMKLIAAATAFMRTQLED